MDEARRAWGALEEAAAWVVYEGTKDMMPPADVESEEYERQIRKQHQREAQQEIRARRRTLCPRKAVIVFHRRLLPGKSGGRK